MLTLEHRLQIQPGQPQALGQNGQNRADREIHVPHHGIRRRVRLLQLRLGAAEHRLNGEIVRVENLLGRKQTVEPVAVSPRQRLQLGPVEFIHAKHIDMPDVDICP